MKAPHPMHLDALDAVKPGLVLNVSVRLHNVWRLRLGAFLVRLAARVMRCPIDVQRVGEDDGGGADDETR